jgi:tellurite resistance protein TehA-like permease
LPTAAAIVRPAPSLLNMHPANFAMTMATGIVSIAAHLMGLEPLGRVLFFINLVLFAAVIVLTLWRIVKYPAAVVADVKHHGRSVGFFTAVAATCVVGTQCLLIGGSRPAALVLWGVGLVLWVLINYTVFTVLTVEENKPPLTQGLNGGWLVAVVAAQSCAVLGAQLAGEAGPETRQMMLFVSLTMWLGGGMLYIWIISLIFYRYTFLKLHPSDLAPPYWINMGAVAISTLAGTMLIAQVPGSPLLRSLLPFLEGMTLLFWSTATWWIPMLVILGLWRHVYQGFPLRYDPLYWGAVFPLGMYAACTFRLSHVLNQPFLMVIPHVFLWVALTAWLFTAIGLALQVTRIIRGWAGPPRPAGA